MLQSVTIVPSATDAVANLFRIFLSSQNSSRANGLDTLRASAIALVFMNHYMAFVSEEPTFGWGSVVGWTGVDLFFVLSGYLIANQLFSGLARGETLSPPQFYARRAFRTLPAYWVILALYFLFPAFMGGHTPPPLWRFLTFTQNLGLEPGTAFSHAWSLAVEDQFYLLLPFVLLFISRWRRAAFIVPCAIVLGGLILRATLAYQNLRETGVAFRGYQTWIYYATWTRLDPLVFGVVLAAIEKFRPQWWQRLVNLGPFLWLPAFAVIAYALYLGETKEISVVSCIWQFPLIALGMAALLVSAVSPRLPFRRFKIPGTAFIASIAYSAYLVQKLVIHFAQQFCASHNITMTSASALVTVQLCIFAVATVLFFAVERPFLQLRHRIVSRG